MTKSRIRVLTNDEYIDAVSHFEACFQTVWSNLSPADQLAVKRWIEQVNLITPAYSLRADAISGITAYPTELVRDFMFDLCFMFFASWGVDQGVFRLAASMAEGLAVDGPNSDLSLIDDNVLGSMSVASTHELQRPFPIVWWKRWLGIGRPPALVEILASNKPLLMVYLMYLSSTYAALTRSDAPAGEPAADTN